MTLFYYNLLYNNHKYQNYKPYNFCDKIIVQTYVGSMLSYSEFTFAPLVL